MSEESRKWALPAFIATLALLIAAAVFIAILATRQGGKVELTLDDEHTAAWILHDNAFAYEGADPDRFRSGAVFQLGDYREHDDQHSIRSFASIEIRGKKSTETFNRGDFYWINIVGKDDEKTEDPIDEKDVGLLYPDPNTATQCSNVEPCAGVACLCPPDSASGTPETIREECLRLRRIDARFEPDSVITYWQGKDGYDIKVRDNGRHGQLTFLLKDSVNVTVYREGQLPLDLFELVGTIQKIHIKGHPPDVNHGEAHDPGMGGGK